MNLMIILICLREYFQNPLEGVFHSKCLLCQTNFHTSFCMCLIDTSVRTCIDVQLQRNIQIQGYAGCEKKYIIAWTIFTTMRNNFINSKLNLLLRLYHQLQTSITKHKGFDKNWNNVFRHRCWYMTIDMFVVMSTINPHTCNIVIFILYFNHE